MRQNLPNYLVFALLSVALVGGYYYLVPTPVPKPVLPAREGVEALIGAAPHLQTELKEFPPRSRYEPPKPVAPAPVPRAAGAAPPKPAAPAKPVELIAVGSPDAFLAALLTTQGGSLQSVILNRFEEANRLGREVKVNGETSPLRLIPGVKRPRDPDSLQEADGGAYPALNPGTVSPATAAILSEPSYQLLHYPSPDDPLASPSDADRMNSKYPSPELAERVWELEANDKSSESQRVVFKTSLGAPYFLTLRKIFTYSPVDYHLGFAIEIQADAGREKSKGTFRYQLSGPRGIPVEGEWYAQSYRNVYTGSIAPNGRVRRTLADAATVNAQHGGQQVPAGADQFKYAAVGSQYFASALAIDDTVEGVTKRDVWDYVRPTREPSPSDPAYQNFLSDVTFRAVSKPLELDAGQTVRHAYLIYNGPLKVRLLKQQVGRANAGKPEPEPARADLVDRYADDLTLATLTDYASPNVFGRIASAIYWSDVVIFFTNKMHGLLGFFHRYVPVWGLNIVMLTVLVRLLLLVPSRRQQYTMAVMQAKQAAMKPEADALAEKYKDDPTTLQQEKMRLAFKHGINPLGAMGGCLLLFAQAPILTGLYFCLQESVFFRLEPFLWFPNLAAPDMLAYWGERVPVFTTLYNLGAIHYFGPYLNILPLLAAALIFVQMSISMPPPMDENQEFQQKIQRFMPLMMVVFFYKMPAGLCLYFICGTAWAIAERKLMKKPVITLPPSSPGGGCGGSPAKLGPTAPGAPATPGAQGKGLMGRLRERLEEQQRLQAEQQMMRQVRNPERPGDTGKATDPVANSRAARRVQKKKRK